MEASTLRWVLIILGVLILGAILFFGNPEKMRKPRASRRREPAPDRREPTLEPPTATGPPTDDGATGSGQWELEIDAAPESGPEAAREPPGPARPPPDEIVTLYILARDNNVITGAELLQAALRTGMEFGEMSIFHRIPEGASEPVFSLANAVEPGRFDREGWNTLETGGLAMFMTLPGPVAALDAWDSMLATARRISELLHADIEDGEHHPFTRLREAQIREEMRDYDRRQNHVRA